MLGFVRPNCDFSRRDELELVDCGGAYALTVPVTRLSVAVAGTPVTTVCRCDPWGYTEPAEKNGSILDSAFRLTLDLGASR